MENFKKIFILFLLLIVGNSFILYFQNNDINIACNNDNFKNDVSINLQNFNK